MSAALSAVAAFRHADRGALWYGLTPPRLATERDRADEITRVTLGRLAPVRADALIVYDVDGEADRSATERPFPFLPMMDPAVFAERHLAAAARIDAAWTDPPPVVVYRCVGKYAEAELADWFAAADPDRTLTVLVGPSSRDQKVTTRLVDAHSLRAEVSPRLPLGGVVIAERHARRGDEHLRMLAKQEAGCTFFVSQVCYDVDHTRDLLSDYAYTCRERGLPPQPVVLTTSPCGSQRTLEFMTWLGIDVPHWIRNEIRHRDDPLAATYDHCLAAVRALVTFCRSLELPFGINVESLTNRKAEIEASVALAVAVREVLGRD